MANKSARCGVCGVDIPFEHNNPEDLMLHTQRCHPGITAVRYDLDEVDIPGVAREFDDDDDDDVNVMADSSTGTCNCSSMGVFKVQAAEATPKHKLYRSKVEPWRPGLGYMMCPFCKEMNSPLIQRDKTEMADDSFKTTFWMFACWPLCFLPLVLSSNPQLVYLYCSECHQYLGVYDRENMRVALRKKRETCDPCHMKAKRIPPPGGRK